MKIGLGLTDEEIKKIWEGGQKKIEDGKSSDNTSFSESNSAGDLGGLDPKHAQGIKDLIQFFKQVKVDEFRKLFTIDCMMQDPVSGMLNNDLADKVLQFVNQNKPEEHEKSIDKKN